MAILPSILLNLIQSDCCFYSALPNISIQSIVQDGVGMTITWFTEITVLVLSLKTRCRLPLSFLPRYRSSIDLPFSTSLLPPIKS